MKVLLLHGFTSSLDCINGLEPGLRERGLDYRMPVLKGHGSRPEDLVGVTPQDWLQDARMQLLELAEPCLIVGLSMGALVALQLAAEHPTRVAGVATVAACLRFRSPLIYLMPVIQRFYTWWPGSPDYADPTLAQYDTNYKKFPVRTFAQLLAYTRVVDDLLVRVEAPLCVAAARHDPVAHPWAARRIYERCRSSQRELHWFERSRHEMLRDVEREAVYAVLLHFIDRVGR